MSFWDTLGHLSTAANPMIGVFDAARAASLTEDPSDGPDSTTENAKQFGAAFFKGSSQMMGAKAGLGTLNSAPVQKVLYPIAWTGNQLDHGLAAMAAGGDALHAQGRNDWSIFTDDKAWDDAWAKTEHTSIGEYLVGSATNLDHGAAENAAMVGYDLAPNAAKIRDDFEADRQKAGFRVAAGATDILATWYADPTIIGGKAAKAARVGSTIIDAAHADEVAGVIGQAGKRGAAAKAAGTFSTAPEETASRLYAQVSKTDNMSVTDAAAHFKPMLERSGDSAPIVGLLGQAGSIADVTLQRAVKADTLLAAAGSSVARDRLIQNAPDIARALQRSATPPEQFKIVDDMVASGLSGDALLNATQQWASKGNRRELEAYAKHLDDIHTRIAKTVEVGEHGGVQDVGGSVLGAVKQKYRAGMAREFFYSPGPSARTVRVVHWATGQRMKGVIDVSDAVRGHDELMDSMTRSGLFTGGERQRMATKWWSAPTQEARASIAHSYPTFMLAKLAEKHALSKTEMKDVLRQYGDWSAKARTYTTKQLEAARVGNLSRVTLEDPGTGVPVSIDKLLFEKHVATSAAVPDLNSLERLIRARKDASSLGDRVKDKVSPLWNSLEDVNDIWRTLTLARPGFIARTQFDTQARSMVTIGATNIVADAMRGLGHKVSDKLTGAQVQEVVDHAETLTRRENLTAQAAELRRQADLMDNGHGGHLYEETSVTSPAPEPAFAGGKPLFHGTSERFPNDAVNPDPYGGSGAGNLFGYGFYTTDDASMARSYNAKGGGKNSTTYGVKWTGEEAPKVLDLENSVNPTVRDWLRAQVSEGGWADNAPTDTIEALAAKIKDPKVSDRELLLDVRKAMRETDMTSADADEIYGDLAESLSGQYDAISHVGGLYAGKGAHKHGVTIFLDPSKLKVADHVEGSSRRISSKTAARGGSGSAQRLRDRADALEAQAAQDVTKVVTGKHLVTDERKVDLGNGVSVKERAVGSDVERQMLTPALHTGPQSISDAILHVTGKLQGELAEDANKWVTTMPESDKWSAAWLRSKDALVASPAGKKILETLDLPNVDMMKALRESTEVRAAWREVRTGNPDFESWLDRAIAQAEWTAPTTTVRQTLLSGRVLKTADAEALFAKADDAESVLPARMPVHAPAMDVINPLKQRRTIMDGVRKMVRTMSDQPDTVLGRVPFYTERYFKHFEELGRREVDRTGELGAEARASIEKVARHRAIMDTRQTMYDTARFTGAHDRSARMMFAFLGAWEDSMRAWGKMFYDDPSRIGKLTKTWYAPDRAGFIVDENGDRVKPGDDSREKWIVLPISIPGTQVKEFKLRKDSFNSMFQGDVPWAPGFSPMTQVPVTQIAARVFPEIADENYTVHGAKVGANPLVRQMFGFGIPKTGVSAGAQVSSVRDQVTPGWVRRAFNIADGNSQQFIDAYSMGLNAALIQARQEGKDPNSKAVQEWADKQAGLTARTATFMEFISNFGLGLSGEGATKAEFYRERYREISANADALTARGSSVNEEFLRQHPEAAGLKWSFTQNDTGINATLQVENRSRKYGKDISKNPEFGWFYVGSDNIGGEFSSAIYSSQFNREGAAGSGDAWRSRQNPAEIHKATNASLGWDSWNAVNEKVNLILAERGLTSVSQKGAEDLKQIKANFRDELGAQNADWFKDYSSFDSSKMQTFLTQVAQPALKDGRLKGRSDIKTMGDYLELRQKATDIANQNGYSLGSQKAANLRQILNDAGAQMAADNLGFSQMWTRTLSREVEE